MSIDKALDVLQIHYEQRLAEYEPIVKHCRDQLKLIESFKQAEVDFREAQQKPLAVEITETPKPFLDDLVHRHPPSHNITFTNRTLKTVILDDAYKSEKYDPRARIQIDDSPQAIDNWLKSLHNHNHNQTVEPNQTLHNHNQTVEPNQGITLPCSTSNTGATKITRTFQLYQLLLPGQMHIKDIVAALYPDLSPNTEEWKSERKRIVQCLRDGKKVNYFTSFCAGSIWRLGKVPVKTTHRKS